MYSPDERNVVFDMALKEQLIDKVLHDPLGITEEDFKLLVAVETGLSFDDLRNIVRRIYDINERTLLEESDASKGSMGFFNRLSTKSRTKKYYKKIRKGFRGISGNRVIVAEGDSWFQFPLFVTDVVDWLLKKNNYAIYSIASGGDWMTNIIYDGKYVEELSIHQPDVFLISGSGNDLVGSNRLAIMVEQPLKNQKINDILIQGLNAENKHAGDIKHGFTFLTSAFHAFILVLKLQYYILFKGIRSSRKLCDMLIITQGYDYAIPSYKIRFDIRYPLQPVINWALDSGKWLKRPLMIRGIVNDYDQRSILKAM